MGMKTILKTLGKGAVVSAVAMSSSLALAQVKEFRILESGGPSGESIEKAYITPFTEKTGIKVTRESPTSLGKLQAMVQSGNATSVLVELGSTNLFMARALDLVEPLDWDKINPDPMFEEAKLPDGFGYQYFSTILAWKEGAPKLESWADFWDTEKFPGKRALPDYPGYTLPLALLADGVKPEELYPLDVERAFKSFREAEKGCGRMVACWGSVAATVGRRRSDLCGRLVRPHCWQSQTGIHLQGRFAAGVVFRSAQGGGRRQ